MANLLPVTPRHSWWSAPGTLLDRFLEDFGGAGSLAGGESWIPAIDVRETGNEILVSAELPGMSAEDVDVSLDRGVLTVRGEKRHEHEEKKESWRLVERRYGSFSRSIRVPVDVAEDRVEASFRDGVLNVTLPKGEEERKKRIDVKTS